MMIFSVLNSQDQTTISRFLAQRVINVWNSLLSTTNFSLLAMFKSTICDADFLSYLVSHNFQPVLRVP